MTEEFLYYIWQFRLWKGELKSSAGEILHVEKPGLRNENAGPDFLNAQIRIGNVLWNGNVEIHVKTSDWYFHDHQDDENYKNLILHVVFNHDMDDLPHDCPLLTLKDHIPKELLENYRNLNTSRQFIPCEDLFAQADEFTVSTFLETLFIQRLQEKVKHLENRLDLLNGDWEGLLFERIAWVFGLKVNAEAFELLAKSFPFRTLQQVIRKNENTEALLFGQAGFLDDPKDLYQAQLKHEYEFLKHKYALRPVQNHLFKFLRLRPPNFPTVRIAQLAALYRSQDQLFTAFMKIKTKKGFKDKFSSISASFYWDTHYNFKTESKSSVKKITEERIDLLLLNAIVPVKYLYLQKHGNEDIESILAMVRSVKPEKNAVIENFGNIGAKITNAMESQAYLELKKTLCDHKKCLHCRIGNKIIQHA